MKLIRSVEIERFRSCESARLHDIGDVTALVGPNNTGKSNVLRALNLFFNDETDPGTSMDFDIDYRLGSVRKRNKSIRICVEFELPQKFHFRKGLAGVVNLLGRHFWLARIWTARPDPLGPQFEFSLDGQAFGLASAEEVVTINQFLKLISFRYIPNRAIPVQVIREESRDVLGQLARRVLKAGGTGAAPILDGLSEAGGELARPIAADLIDTCVGVTDLELSTPTQIVDMLGEARFKSSMGLLGKVDDTALGAGVQSLLMFHLLHLVDQDQFQRGFGWRQAAIWAVEEPESALHRQLQVRLASLLRAYAIPGDSRFQILLTTHNDVFVYGATAGFLVALDHSPATTVERSPVLDLAREAASQEVTSLPSPALQFPFHTVVVVEGDTDVKILSHAAHLTEMCQGVKFVRPCRLDPGAADGVKGVRRFVVSCRHVLPQRLSGHPLLVLLDWEVSDDSVGGMAAKYGAGGTANVRKMDEDWADPLVGKSFKGIERFYSAEFLKRAARAGIAEIGTVDDGRLVVEQEELKQRKSRLAEFFVTQGERSDCEHLVAALRWASSIV